MKKLYLVRHAKSNLKQPGLSDFERPLLEKGKKRTKHIIDFLIKKKVDPDLIISSSAYRAIETARYIAKGLSYPEYKIKSLSYYYKIDCEGILNDFMDFSDDYDTVMIIGHNPALTNFANRFLKTRLDSLPTSGVVCFNFNMNKWEDIEAADCNTEFVTFPSELTKTTIHY